MEQAQRITLVFGIYAFLVMRTNEKYVFRRLFCFTFYETIFNYLFKLYDLLSLYFNTKTFK